MNYTKAEVNRFRDTVCPNCICTEFCIKTDKFCMGCPKIFNWKLYGTEDGSNPKYKELKWRQPKK